LNPAGCNPAGFNVMRAPGTSGGTFTLVAQIGFTETFADTTVTPGTTYRYQVRARSANGLVSGPSNTVQVSTPTACLLIPPPAPGNLTAVNVTAVSVGLTWAVTAAPGCLLTYEILRAPGVSGGTFTTVGTTPGNGFTDTGLTPGTTYRYQGRTRDQAGNLSALSNTVTVTTSPGTGGCSATYRVANAWGGAFQGEVVVTNSGTSPIGGWRVTLSLSSGASITQIWGGRTSQTTSPYTVTNESWNGALAPNAMTTFGFNANVSGSTGATGTVTCTAE
jgi:chitodextrinase